MLPLHWLTEPDGEGPVHCTSFARHGELLAVGIHRHSSGRWAAYARPWSGRDIEGRHAGWFAVRTADGNLLGTEATLDAAKAMVLGYACSI